ncbi:putative phosphatase [compost metagenome]
MIRVVFSDVDGTLLNSRHQISPGTKTAVRRLEAEGVPFILVTARSPQGVMPLYRELGVAAPLICFSGALVLENREEGGLVPVYSVCLPAPAALDIVELAAREHPEISVNVYSHDRWLTGDAGNAWVLQEQAIVGVQAEQADLTEFLRRGGEVHKLLCMGPPDSIAEFYRKLGWRSGEVNVYPSKDSYLEIMAGEASKSQAIALLLERLGLELQHAMAIGDNYNDMDMLAYAGLGVAMGNAPEAVRQFADEITLTHDEDGLVWSLRKHVLIRQN